MSSKHFGICALCGKKKELTFEHLPPKNAFNFTPTKPIRGEVLIHASSNTNRVPWDLSGLKYENQQRGFGSFSLCQSCNNLTGTWYGDSYVDFAKKIHVLLSVDIPRDAQQVEFLAPAIYPQRIIKQVISVFCSLNKDFYDDPRIISLRGFVLNKDAVSLDKSKYKVCMYLTRSELMKYCGLSTHLNINDMQNITHKCISEYCAYPLGFLIYFDPDKSTSFLGTDITAFSDYRFNDSTDFQITTPIVEINSWLPEDTRSKAEIEQIIKTH